MAYNGYRQLTSRFFNPQYYFRCERLIRQKRLVSLSPNTSSKKIDDTPLIYSQTKPYTLRVKQNFDLEEDPRVFASERYVIVFSCAVLMIYLFFIRKENYIDEILKGTYDSPDDEERKVMMALLHAKLQGLKTEKLEEKLAAIRANKN